MDRYLERLIKAYITLLTVLVLPLAAYAADVNNVGFKRDASMAVKERFGICDEFLDVKWIDKVASVGTLKADVYKNGMSETRYLVVRLEKPGSKDFVVSGSGIFYEIDEKQYVSHEFENFLRGARYSFNHGRIFMTVRKGKKSDRFPQEPLPFESFMNHESDFPNRSFSSFTKTVCIAYPDEKRAFVIEAKKPFMKSPLDSKTRQTYDILARHVQEQCGKLESGGAEAGCNLDNLKDSYALDANGDGKDDYVVLLTYTKTGKARAWRYMFLSGKEGYVATDVSGCLGEGRFFYGLADGKSFHLGRCSR
ncbi:MAG: hypothetical protein ACLPN1_09960 [Dissulfurispiraceae bacterium]|jgi:hypothetical protein